MTDKPHVRKLNTCIGCSGSKDDHLLLCWPCHRAQMELHHGRYSDEIEQRLVRAEAILDAHEAAHKVADQLWRLMSDA